MKKLILSDDTLNRESTELQISEVIEAAIDSIRDYCTDRSVTIEYNSPEKEFLVLTNQDKLTDVLKKLLFISVKFNERNDKIIIEQNVLLGRRHNDNNDFIHILIRVCSMALSNYLLEVKLDSSRSSGDSRNLDYKEKLAIELSSSKAMVKELGGNFWVKRLPDNGMTFNLTIPSVKLVEE